MASFSSLAFPVRRAPARTHFLSRGALLLASLALAVPSLKSAGAATPLPGRTQAVEAAPGLPHPSPDAAARQFELTPSPVTEEKQGSSVILKQTLTGDIPAGRFKTLKLKNNNGNYEITGWDEPRITIEAEKRAQINKTRSGVFGGGKGTDSDTRQAAERGLRELNVNIKPANDTMEIKAVFPKAPSGVSLSNNFKIKVPRAMRVEAETANGNGQAEGIQQSAKLHTNNGNLTAKNIGGDLEATSSNGNIDLKAIAGNIKASHANGNIDASGIRGAAALSGSNGNIRADYAQLPAAGRKITVKTGNGSVSLTLPQASAFDLEARTHIGQIASQFPIAVSGRGIGKTARGQVGTGGPQIELETNIGQITIEKR